MFEKVNPKHPDKVADRIAGAIVDLAYAKNDNPKCAVEVLLGHGIVHVINETDTPTRYEDVLLIIKRLVGNDAKLDYKEVKQDVHLANNQKETIKCGDNGIFKGVPVTNEEKELTAIAKAIYSKYDSDGKYILDKNNNKLIICQSNASNDELRKEFPNAIINPLGEWTGGYDVDSGATNRKLGSDMAQSVTGGGLHGKDLSKADVSVNIYAFLKAQETKRPVELFCAIGDTQIDGKPYNEIVELVRQFIKDIGGFEKFAEWGLVND